MYVQSDALLLFDVFENFRNKSIEIYELDPAHFLPAPRLVWQSCFKKTELELELLTYIDMLLMIENGIKGGMCQTIHRYVKAKYIKNNKYMKNYDKNIESSYLMYIDAKKLYGRAMSQKLPVNGFEWVNDLSQFKEDFIKNYDNNSHIGYFLEVDVGYPKKLSNLLKDLPVLPERKKIEKCSELVRNVQDKEYYVIHTRALKQALNHELKLKMCIECLNLIKKHG